AQPAAAEVRVECQRDHAQINDPRDQALPAPPEDRVDDVPAVKLSDRQQVQTRHQHPHPRSEEDRVELEVTRQMEQSLEQQEEERVMKNWGLTGEWEGRHAVGEVERHERGRDSEDESHE